MGWGESISANLRGVTWEQAIPIAEGVAAWTLSKRKSYTGMETCDLVQELLLRFPQHEGKSEQDLRTVFIDAASEIIRKSDPLGIGLKSIYHGYPGHCQFGGFPAAHEEQRLRAETIKGSRCTWCGEFYEPKMNSATCSTSCQKKLTHYRTPKNGIRELVPRVLALLESGPTTYNDLVSLTSHYIGCLKVLERLGYKYSRRKQHEKRGIVTYYEIVSRGVSLPC